MNQPAPSINDFRRRILAGEDIPAEELAAAVALFRSGRTATVVAKAEAKAKANEPLDLAALFSAHAANAKKES